MDQSLLVFLNQTIASPAMDAVALAVLAPFSLAAIEECLQHLSPLRTFDLTDLASDLGGMLVFAALSAALLRLERTRHARQNDLAGAD
jgi:VanZ family protein